LFTCTFCRIVARQEPATIRYEDNEVVVFNNRLHWAPVMLLVIPRQHLSQEELWGSGLLAKVGKVALQIGTQLCPGGFRLLANLGPDAQQTQTHGHLHVIGGAYLGPYA